MRRQDVLDSMHLAWEVTELKSSDGEVKTFFPIQSQNL